MTEIKNKIKAVAIKTKNHVVKHKAAYAFGGLAITAVALQRQQTKSFDAFLVEKGIDPMEYWLTDTDYESLQNL